MIFIRSSISRQFATLALLSAVGTVGVSCSKSTKGETGVITLGGGVGGSVGAEGTPGAGGTGSGNATAVDPNALQNLQNNFQNTTQQLKDGLAQEATARQAADQHLQDQITTLQGQYTSLAQALAQAQTDLGGKITAIQNDVACYKTTNDATIATLESQMNQSAIDVRTNIQNQVNTLQAKLTSSPAPSDADKTIIANQIASLTTILGQSDATVLSQHQQDLQAQIGKLNEAYKSCQGYVAGATAAGNVFNSVAVVVNSLYGLYGVLDKKVDDVDAQLSKSISLLSAQEQADIAGIISKEKTDIQSVISQEQTDIKNINTQITDIQNVQKEMSAKISDYQTQINNLTAYVNVQVQNVRVYIDQARAGDQAAIAQLQAGLSSLNGRVGVVECLTSKIRESLLQKQAEINKLQQQQNATQSQLSQAIATEQQDRQAVTAAIGALQADLDCIRRLAAQALNLAQADKDAIAGIAVQLKNDEARWGKQIADLKSMIQSSMLNISQQTIDITNTVGIEMSANLTNVNNSIVEINQRANVTINVIVANIFNNDANKLQDFLQAHLQVSNNLQTANNALAQSTRAYTEHFADALDLVTKSSGVDVGALNAQYAQIAQSCGGTTQGVTYAEIGGIEFHEIIATRYLNLLLSPAAQNASPNISAMYYGFAPLQGLDGTSLASAFIVKNTTPQLNITANVDVGACLTKVQAFADGALYGNSASSVKLRALLANSRTLRDAASDVRAKAAVVTTISQQLVTIIEQKLAPVVGSVAAVDKLLNESVNGQPCLNAQIVALFWQQAKDASQYQELTAERDRIIGLARDLATDKAAFDVKLQKLMTDLEATKNITQQEVVKLTNADQLLFAMVAQLADRAGFANLSAQATAAMNNLSTTTYVGFNQLPVGVKAAQLTYDYPQGADAKGAPKRDSPTGTGWAGHPSSGSDNVWLRNWTTDGTSFPFIRGVSIHDYNQLPIHPYNPTDAQARILVTRPLSLLSGETTLKARWWGNSNGKFRVQSAYGPRNRAAYIVNSSVSDGQVLYSVDLNANDFMEDTSKSSHQYVAALPQLTGAAVACYDSRIVTFMALDRNNNPVGDQVQLTYNTYFSPLVLDLAGLGHADTTNALQGGVKFDLEATGEKINTGWIKSTQGFLVLPDSKGNVTSGAQMFGEATLIEHGAQKGQRAVNGYAALAQYDVGHKGYVDATDPVWSKLKVWVDLNGDGVAHKSELRSLSAFGITRLSTGFTEVAKGERIQNQGLPTGGNMVKYEARYFGPEKCGTEGCKTFDVYFGTVKQKVVSAK